MCKICNESMFMSCVWPLGCVFAGCTRQNWTVPCRKPWVPSCGADKLWITPVLRWSLPSGLSYTDLTLPCQVLHAHPFETGVNLLGKVLIFHITLTVCVITFVCALRHCTPEYVSGGGRDCVFFFWGVVSGMGSRQSQCICVLSCSRMTLNRVSGVEK